MFDVLDLFGAYEAWMLVLSCVLIVAFLIICQDHPLHRRKDMGRKAGHFNMNTNSKAALHRATLTRTQEAVRSGKFTYDEMEADCGISKGAFGRFIGNADLGIPSLKKIEAWLDKRLCE